MPRRAGSSGHWNTLLIPVGLLLLLTAWFRIRLGKLQGAHSHVSPQAPEGEGRSGAEKWTSGTESQNHLKPQPYSALDSWWRDNAVVWNG